MGSKRLNRPAANFDYPQTGQVSVTKSVSVPKKPVISSRGRQSVHQQGNDESWKDALPAYQFSGKKHKKVTLPERDSSLLGGFSNLKASNMTVQSAKSYMEAKEAAEELKRKEEQKKNAEFNPFYDMFSE